jgi:hypothetical protein
LPAASRPLSDFQTEGRLKYSGFGKTGANGSISTDSLTPGRRAAVPNSKKRQNLPYRLQHDLMMFELKLCKEKD